MCSRSPEHRLGATSRQIDCTFDSEILKPFEDGLVGSPGRFARTHHGCDTLDGGALHIQIDGGVSVRGCQAGVSEPLTDCGYVYARLEQGNRSAVSHAMWVQVLSAQGSHFRSGAVYMFGENVSNSEARQRYAPMIQKQSGIGPEIDPPLLTESPQDFGSLWPERAVPLFAALAKHPELVWPDELQIACSKVNHLLHASTGVKHGRQQSVVAAAVCGTPVHSGQYGFDLIAIKIFNDTLVSSFEGNANNALGLFQVFRIASADTAKEGMDGGKTDITSRHTVLAILLQMSKKRKHPLRLDVIEVQFADLNVLARSHKAKQQNQAVAITVNGVMTHSAKPWKVISEIVA
jgi:hypothetical protein